MFGISSAELLVIAFVAILVFGPERVPEFFHRAGKLIRGLQDTADEVWTSLRSELDEVTEPLREAERDIRKLGDEIMKAGSLETAESEAPDIAAIDDPGDDAAADDEPAEGEDQGGVS